MATLKQKKAFKAVVNGSTIKAGMLQAGYSEETAKRTNKVTRTKGWQELMEKHLPDALLAKKHKEGLDAVTKKPHLVDRDDKGRPVYEYVSEDDFAVRHKYLDSAYKLKGRYAESESNGGTKILIVLPPQLIEKNGINAEPGTNSDW